MAIDTPRRIGRTSAIQRDTDAENVKVELRALLHELREDVVYLSPRIALLASVAHHLGPRAHQAAVGAEHRIGRMSRRITDPEGGNAA